MQLTLTIAVIGIICLIAAASFFAASEASLLALSRLRIVQRDHDGQKSRLVKLLDERNQYLTTILVGNTFVLLGAQSLATWVAIEYVTYRPVLTATIVMSFVLLIAGEIVPKMVVVQDAAKWAPRFARLLSMLNVVLRPITWSVVGITSRIIKLLGGDPNAAGPYVTEDDIRTLVNVGEQHGALEEEEKEMIHSIFEFGDTVVREVMTPRTDMICADASDPVSEGVAVVIREGYSKLPIFEENIDHIIGVVHDRELLGAVSRGELTIPLRTLMRPIKAIPENKKVDELLREMQAEKVSVAIVVDEYGGTAGLVTMEDLLEEIVGEIMDEYDREEHDRPPEITPAGDREYIVDARMNIDDVNEQLGLHLPTEDFESIGGYTFGLFGRVPVPGEHVVIDGGVTLVVEKTAGRRLLSVRIKNAPPAEQPDEGVAAQQAAEH
ncbi:MAG: HlyC/CorC family transporter [Candidatus Eremiobacteraeota bacterium]|nr:HlyC/CorC family transporter [Candidatus Eremiobacteraeota bacterium]MBV8204817.1 HlyC/CorC family transporter [Candidatus Eremiobacteraeota bacterium]MBV8263014.1 HlyC/CorC family transporter [Candidatus Eremiobacteraeota bacterium]MBV8339181.1 HlyC/CorC family transporter [Candidatus Eremiobacteraeota bacterium]MBV8596861.1 HlyC/CorC family transporter [Candidatus Eremiobacteraeota bacterium]